MARSVPPFPMALLLLAGGCVKPAAPPPVDSAAMAAAHAGIPAMNPEVRLVAGLTLALRSHPEMADSMWAAYRITPAQFDSMKAEVLADSTKRASFVRLTGDTAQHAPRQTH